MQWRWERVCLEYRTSLKDFFNYYHVLWLKSVENYNNNFGRTIDGSDLLGMNVWVIYQAKNHELKLRLPGKEEILPWDWSINSCLSFHSALQISDSGLQYQLLSVFSLLVCPTDFRFAAPTITWANSFKIFIYIYVCIHPIGSVPLENPGIAILKIL